MKKAKRRSRVVGSLAVFAAATLALNAGAAALAQDYAAINATVAQSWSGVAPCLSRSLPITDYDAMTAHFARESELVDAQVGPYEFRDQPESLVNALGQLISASGSTRYAQVQKGCKDPLCAARAMLGDEIGPRVMWLAAAYHFLPLYNASDDTQKWTADELDIVAAAFGDLPASMFPMRDEVFRKLVRRRDATPLISAKAGYVEVIAQAGAAHPGVLIQRGWFHLPADQRRAIIVHELAHEFIYQRSEGVRWPGIWMDAMEADARLARGTGKPSEPSAYAATHVGEDFAESFTAYRYMAPMLKQRAPHRYKLLKSWAFDGLEYGAASSCAPRQAKSAQLVELALRDIEAHPMGPEDHRGIYAACKVAYLNDRRGIGVVRLSQVRCASRIMIVTAFRKAWAANGDDGGAGSAASLKNLVANRSFADAAIGVATPSEKDALLSHALDALDVP